MLTPVAVGPAIYRDLPGVCVKSTYTGSYPSSIFIKLNNFFRLYILGTEGKRVQVYW